MTEAPKPVDKLAESQALHALNKIIDELAPLAPEARARVLRTVFVFFGIPLDIR